MNTVYEIFFCTLGFYWHTGTGQKQVCHVFEKQTSACLKNGVLMFHEWHMKSNHSTVFTPQQENGFIKVRIIQKHHSQGKPLYDPEKDRGNFIDYKPNIKHTNR